MLGLPPADKLGVAVIIPAAPDNDRHPEARAQRASKDAARDWAVALRGPPSGGRLRVTEKASRSQVPLVLVIISHVTQHCADPTEILGYARADYLRSDREGS